MSGQRLYDLVGRRPLTDADLAAAIEQYRADHPGAGRLQLGGAELRMLRLNAKARDSLPNKLKRTRLEPLSLRSGGRKQRRQIVKAESAMPAT